jgi:hypothetical protein
MGMLWWAGVGGLGQGGKASKVMEHN